MTGPRHALLAACLCGLATACTTNGTSPYGPAAYTGFGYGDPGPGGIAAEPAAFPAAPMPPVAPADGWRRIDPSGMLARLGAAPSEVIAAREYRSAGGEYVQVATLANDTAVRGENRLVLSMLRGGLGFAPEGPRQGHYAFTPETLPEVLEETVPGATVQGAPQPRRNRLGIYYTQRVRHADGPQCVVAWQVLEPERIRLDADKVTVLARWCGSTAEQPEGLLDSLGLAF